MSTTINLRLIKFPPVFQIGTQNIEFYITNLIGVDSKLLLSEVESPCQFQHAHWTTGACCWIAHLCHNPKNNISVKQGQVKRVEPLGLLSNKSFWDQKIVTDCKFFFLFLKFFLKFTTMINNRVSDANNFLFYCFKYILCYKPSKYDKPLSEVNLCTIHSVDVMEYTWHATPTINKMVPIKWTKWDKIRNI